MSIANNGCAASLIGLLIINNDIDIVASHYYYIENAKENYGSSISVDQENKYILGCFIGPSDCQNIGIPTAINGALLKVHPNGDPIFFNRYNTYDAATLHHRGSCIAHDAETNQDEYLMLTKRTNEVRLIRTDNNGLGCGREQFDVSHGTISPSISVYNLSYNTINTQENIDLVQVSQMFEICECEGEDAQSYCDPFTFIEELDSTNSLIAFPNPVSTSFPIIQVQGDFGTEFEIHLLNSMGQEVFRASKHFASELTLTLPKNLSAGVYVIEIVNTQNQQKQSGRIVLY
jgi:hypothetical protein